jgi:hypothetical protein
VTLQPAMGNPSDSAKRLIDALRGGTDLDTATLFAGLEPSDFTPELWEEVVKARAEAVVRAVAQIQKAAHQGDWKAAAWWLERQMPEAYGVKKQETGGVVTLTCVEGHSVTMSKRPEQKLLCGLCGSLME